MRLIKNYYFDIGTKIPYSEWPSIVHQFLEENNLTAHRFLYYFDELLSSRDSIEDALQSGPCAKMRKDCQPLGEIRLFKGAEYGLFNTLFLSNIDRPDDVREETILPLMKKIHRRYGFSENNLYYFDIDFFGKRTEFARDCSFAEEKAKKYHAPIEPTMLLSHQPYGSGIILHRHRCNDNYIQLSVDILHDGEVLDATPYCESMQKLLPKCKPRISLEIYLSEEEKQNIERINQAAEGKLQECREYFTQHFPSSEYKHFVCTNYSLAEPLKKFAKQHGYKYKFLHAAGVWSLEKRTAHGNVLSVGIESGTFRSFLRMYLNYEGVGFFHHLGGIEHTPTTQEEVDACLEQVMSTICEFERTLLPSLDALFPETPSWFIPK